MPNTAALQKTRFGDLCGWELGVPPKRLRRTQKADYMSPGTQARATAIQENQAEVERGPFSLELKPKLTPKIRCLFWRFLIILWIGHSETNELLGDSSQHFAALSAQYPLNNRPAWRKPLSWDKWSRNHWARRSSFGDASFE